jgi:hypothetical protein
MLTKTLSLCLLGFALLSFTLLLSLEDYKKENEHLKVELATTQEINRQWSDRYNILEESLKLDAGITTSYIDSQTSIESAKDTAILELETIYIKEQCNATASVDNIKTHQKTAEKVYVETNSYAPLNGELPPAVGWLLDKAYDCAASGSCGERDSSSATN